MEGRDWAEWSFSGTKLLSNQVMIEEVVRIPLKYTIFCYANIFLEKRKIKKRIARRLRRLALKKALKLEVDDIVLREEIKQNQARYQLRIAKREQDKLNAMNPPTPSQ